MGGERGRRWSRQGVCEVEIITLTEGIGYMCKLCCVFSGGGFIMVKQGERGGKGCVIVCMGRFIILLVDTRLCGLS